MAKIVVNAGGALKVLWRVWRIGDSWVITIPAAWAAILEEDENKERWMEIDEQEEGILIRPWKPL